MKIKGIGFDWDGVVADSMPRVHECTLAVCRQFKLIEASFDRFYETFRQPYMHYYQGLGLEKVVTVDQVREVYFRRQAELPEPECVPGVAELIKMSHSRGISMAIVSTHKADEIEAWLDKKELRRYFSHVHGMALEKANTLRQLASEYGCDPSEIAMIGDLPSDMEDAKAAGVLGIGFAATINMREILLRAGASYIAHDMLAIEHNLHKLGT